jgi:myo-inositol 2-dehydrogenase / D-chiro-inositol 1-dehydrogenase
MPSELAIAVVGAGRMGRRHLAACRVAAGVRPVAAVDTRREVRDELAAGGLRVHTCLDELVDAGGFDAALIAAPSDLHRDLVAALAKAGVPILCEKPCGLTAEEARDAAAAAASAGVPLQVGYWRRFVPELRELRGRIAGGGLGRLSLVSCHQWDEHAPTQGFQLRSGGIAIDMGVHELDQLRWLGGQEIGRVIAMGGRPSGPPDDPDTAVIAVSMSDGTLGLVTLGRPFPHPDSCWLEAIGATGHVRLPFMWAQTGNDVFARGLVSQVEAFALSVADGRERGAGGADAVAALEAAERARAALIDQAAAVAGGG